MAYDFSIVAQLNQTIKPLMPSKERGTSLELVDAVLDYKTPKTKARIALEAGRSVNNVSDCLKQLKAVMYDKKGPNGSSRWVKR